MMCTCWYLMYTYIRYMVVSVCACVHVYTHAAIVACKQTSNAISKIEFFPAKCFDGGPIKARKCRTRCTFVAFAAYPSSESTLEIAHDRAASGPDERAECYLARVKMEPPHVAAPSPKPWRTSRRRLRAFTRSPEQHT